MELFELQVPRTIRISPDNQQVLYSTTTPTGNRTSEHELSTLWLAKTGHPNSARQVTSGDFNDHHPRWSLDGQRVAFISDRAKRGEQWAIYSVPTDTEEEPAALTPVENEQKIGRFAFSPDRKNIAYLSADEKSEEQRRKEKEKDDAKVYGKDSPFHRLRLVEIATRKVTTLVSRP
jgi:Tol biopolymer transport system component